MNEDDNLGTPEHAIARASLAVILAHALIRLLSLILTIVLAGAYGAGVEMDVYNTTLFGIIWTLLALSDQSVGPVLLPLFMEKKDAGDERGAWRFASNIAAIQLLIFLPVVAALIAFPDIFVRLFTQWEGEEGGDAKIQLARMFLRVISPGLLGLVTATVTYKLLNGYKKFFIAALGDGSLRLAIACAAVIPYVLRHFNPSLGAVSPLYIAVGAFLGCWAKLGTHAVGLGPRLRLATPVLDFKDPALRRFTLLVAPLLVGIVFSKIRDNFNNYWILSTLESGTITINNWGKKIYDTISNLVPYAVSIAMFPFLCRIVDREDAQKLGQTLTFSLRMILFLLVPLTAGVMIVSVPLARALYEHGASNYQTAYMAGWANASYMFGLPFIAAEMILAQAYFSKRRTVSFTIIGIVWSALSMVISYLGIAWLGPASVTQWLQSAGITFSAALDGAAVQGLTGIIIVGFATAFTRAGKTLTLGFVLSRQVPVLRGADSASFLGKLLVATAGSALAVWATRLAYERLFNLSEAAAAAQRGMALKVLLAGELASCAIAGLAVLLALGLLLRMDELPAIRDWLKQRLVRSHR